MSQSWDLRMDGGTFSGHSSTWGWELFNVRRADGLNLRNGLKEEHHWPLSPCRKSKETNGDFSRYSRKRSIFDPRFDPFLSHISRIRFLPDMRFSLKEAHYWPLSTCTISRKNNEDFSRKFKKSPFGPRFDHFLPHISRTKILPDMQFSRKEIH